MRLALGGGGWAALMLGGLLALAASGNGRAEEAGATLRVRTDQPFRRVSPALYGAFFEEINHAGDGGLYAELVRNRDFQDFDPSGKPAAWSLRVDGWARASMALDPSRPLHSATPHAMRLEVQQVEPRVSVINEGYWGVPVRKGEKYRLRLHARRGGGMADRFRVTLESASGRVYARGRISGVAEAWKRHDVTLTSQETDPQARLVISPESNGTLWLDMVSLFPQKTWKGRENGLRPDLAQHVSGMRPAFLRFPGGCFVEGDTFEGAFRWKETLGDISERPGHVNQIWNYRVTNGLGYHEYLQFCEDLGAEPMFVVNCGLSHKQVVPMDQLQPWIQDALDAIEYANGPVTSKWGALRAKHGHPAPFRLKYVEIGNENGMFRNMGGTHAQYAERYRAFYDAIKTRYPEIITITNTPVPHPMELVDDHYYNSPAWFWSNMNRYDTYDRRGPKVYVGEYAVTQNAGKGNLAAALAEAAFMTGFERNADVVVMSSYAPLFVNDRDRKWNPDAIVFDTHRSYGTPSYHVQRLFAEHRPDVVYPVETPDFPAEITPGTVGLGTWQTQAEYRNVRVESGGQVLYAGDFRNGAAGWQPGSGDWRVVDGAYRQQAGGDDRRAVLAMPDLRNRRDYTLTLQARKLGGAEGFLIMFRVADSTRFCWWNIGGWGNTEHSIEKGVPGGAKVQLTSHVQGRVETGRWYDIRIEVVGARIRCYLDGRLIHDALDSGQPDFAVTAGKLEKSGEWILKVVNGSGKPRPVRWDLRTLGPLRATGEVTVLASEKLDDENTFEQPLRIAPTAQPLVGIQDELKHTFPPYSLSIIRLRTR